jgi:hypothetical protein
MEMRHYPVRIMGEERAFALLVPRAPDSAAIFVHGFDGSSDKTWVDFEHLIDQVGPQRSKWLTTDLFFYGYRSHNQFPPLARDFSRFVEAVAARNERLLIQIEYQLPSSKERRYGAPLGLSQARGSGPYKRLLLVGHSTGAVVIRQSLCDFLKAIKARVADLGMWAQERPLPNANDYSDHLIADATVRLFAPAHLGVMAAGPLGLAASLPIIDRIVNSRLRSNPLYQSILPNSPTLANLRSETERWYSELKLQALKARSTFGDKEDVVHVGGYSHDEQVVIEKNQGHTSICKPTLSYTEPLEFVTHEPTIAKRA